MPAPEFPGAWIRPHPGPFIWGHIDDGKGRYRWDVTDNLVRRWQKDRLAVLATVWPFAEWDQKACHADKPKAQGAFPEFGDLLYSPCDPGAYAAWLTALVERYDGDGVDDMPGLQYPIRHWEILNEPTMQGQYGLTFFQEDSAAYLEVLKLSYDTIKEADPNAVVLLGGQAGMQPEFVKYWEPVLKSRGDYFDVGNIHSIGSDIDFFAPEYRAFLDRLGYDAKPFWITEALVGDINRPMLSEDELAQMTLTGYAAAFGAGAQVIFNVGAHDPTGGPGHASELTFLLMAHTVGNFTSATTLAENVVRFDMPDGLTVFALWDGAKLPSEVTGTVTVITYAREESRSDAVVVLATVPMLVKPTLTSIPQETI